AELQFPYIAGLGFVQAVRASGGWKDVNAVYRDPPDSTEQILHPKRYLNRDPPVLIDLDTPSILDTLPGVGWSPFYSSVLGEYRMRLWLEEHLGVDSPLPASAADGWDGDRLRGFQRGEHVIAVLASVWDSPEEATEFAGALVLMANKRRAQASVFERSGRHGGMVCWGLDDGTLTLIERWGTWVIYIEGVPADPGRDVGALREAIWQGRQTGPYPRTQTYGPRRNPTD
ncbi:MAG: hypothetical protein AAFS10_07760, partial [Myxococcota bacterium]